MIDCDNINFFGVLRCKFEPRYDEQPFDVNAYIKTLGTSKASVSEYHIEQMASNRSKNYVRDVCVSCGKTIERNHERRG